MDASRSTITNTSEYLKSSIVHGDRNLGIDQLVWHIENRVSLTGEQFRSVTLPTVYSQIAWWWLKETPEKFKKIRALKVYEHGTIPFHDEETIEWWFVDRDLNWFWIMADGATGRVLDSGSISVRAFVERALKLDGWPKGDIQLLLRVVESLKTFCEEGADNARKREMLLRKAASNHADFMTKIHLILPL